MSTFILYKVTLFITLLLYSVIVSQAFSYIVSLRNVQEELDAASYLAFRKLTDKNFTAKYRWVMYAGLLSNCALLLFSLSDNSTFSVACATTSFAMLLADAAIAVKGNLPINTLINTWTPATLPANWQYYRSRWLAVFSWRQVITIVGFACLLAGAVFS